MHNELGTPTKPIIVPELLNEILNNLIEITETQHTTKNSLRNIMYIEEIPSNEKIPVESSDTVVSILKQIRDKTSDISNEAKIIRNHLRDTIG